jgi:archaellum component FlaC
MDGRFEQIDRRFKQMDGRFEQIDRRFDRMEGRFEGLETDVGLLKLAVTENGRELKQVRASVERLEERVDAIDAKLERKVDRDEVEAIVERVVTRLRPD